MNAKFDQYMRAASPKWRQELFNEVLDLVHAAIPGVEERMMYGRPHFLKAGKPVCAVIIAKDWVNVTILNLPDASATRHGFVPSSAKGVYTLKLAEGQTVNGPALKSLLKASAKAVTV